MQSSATTPQSITMDLNLIWHSNNKLLTYKLYNSNMFHVLIHLILYCTGVNVHVVYISKVCAEQTDEDVAHNVQIVARKVEDAAK